MQNGPRCDRLTGVLRTDLMPWLNKAAATLIPSSATSVLLSKMNRIVGRGAADASFLNMNPAPGYVSAQGKDRSRLR